MAKKSSKTKIKPLTLSFIFLSLSLIVFTLNLWPLPPWYNHIIHHTKEEYPVADDHPRWYNVISEEVEARKIKVGLVNMDHHEVFPSRKDLVEEVVTVDFDPVGESHHWKDFYPTWIDEEMKWHKPTCPEIPMPHFEDYRDIDVVVARVPCGGSGGGGGVRDVFRLQVNLMVANLLVKSGWRNDRTVYAVFVGSCGPMWEIFRCDDLLWHEGEYWVYKPNLGKLKHNLLMPVGSCQLVPHGIPSEEWGGYRGYILNGRPQKPREAYVTVLHSSEKYVCGAIALAQSIMQSNSSRDLVLLGDKSLSQKSLIALQSTGWKVKLIERIHNPHAKRNAPNKWNYSKLRIWELVEYDKLIFIDSDLVVLRNIDHLFVYPQLSARGNNRILFNSGVMVVGPSKCTFNNLMRNRYEIVSYNGGDQGFLNEMFTWWHRLPSKVNHLKIFLSEKDIKNREIPKDVYTIHYLGKKPWLCYKDYDCNWDVDHNLIFASDRAHALWWGVYEAMPKSLQPYCGLTKGKDASLRKLRAKAKIGNFSNGHWQIKVKDPRKLSYDDLYQC